MADKKKADKLVEGTEAIKEPSKKRSRKRQKATSETKVKNSNLRRDRKDVVVEIMNISNGKCRYTDANGRPYFDLEMGELETISLEDLTEVNNRCRGFFRDYNLIVSDVMSEEYTVDDVLNYLGVMRYYSKFQNRNEDFLEYLIFDADYDEFKEAMYSEYSLQRAIAGRMLVAYKDEEEREYIDRDKVRLVGKRLGLREIFEEILLEDLD